MQPASKEDIVFYKSCIKCFDHDMEMSVLEGPGEAAETQLGNLQLTDNTAVPRSSPDDPWILS